MWLYQDADFMRKVFEARSSGKDMSKLGLKPDLSKRGAMRSVIDGRHRFTRYFSPKQHNVPATLEQLFQYNDVELYDLEADPTLEQLFQYNDVELYDLEADPHEMNNLAVDRKANGELLLAMNQKLTDTIAAEVGRDEGDFLPENRAGWAIERMDP
jgi:arylsulfatase